MKNRLQFRHHDSLFSTKTDALTYLNSQMIYTDGKKALYAEPVVLKYGDNDNNPNIILAIGSYGDGETDNLLNKYFIIDTATLERDIAEIKDIIGDDDQVIEELRQAIRDLQLADIELDDKITNALAELDNEISRAKEAEENIIIDLTNLINQEKTRAETAETQIKDDLTTLINDETTRAEAVEKSLTVYVKDSESIKLSKDTSVTGTTINADVKLSSLPGNQLLINQSDVGGGMYYNVNLKYKTGTDAGILELLVNGNVVSTMNLPLERFLKEAYYDNGNKRLVLVFETEGGITETVYIPVGDLVDQYTAGLGLTLNSSNEFSIKFNSTASEPFLVLDSNGLAIQGVQTAINTAITTEKNERMVADQAETTARINANTTLNTKITNEISRATDVENTLRTDLTAEVSRAKASESEITYNLTTLINEEVSRAKLSEQVIKDQSDNNTIKITNLRTDVNSALADVSDVKGGLQSEIARAISNESRIENKTDINTSSIATLRTDLTTEVNRAVAGEMAVYNNAVSTSKDYTDTNISTTKLELSNDIVTSLNNAKAYADTKVNDLATEVQRVDNKSILATSSNGALELTANRETNGNVTINGEIKTAGTNQLLEIKDDGLNVELDVSYLNGVLTLKGSNGFETTTNLAIGGLIQSVEYINHILYIVFKKEGGDIETISINLEELITDWEVNNEKEIAGQKVSVQLFKESNSTIGGLDQLSANVRMMNYNPSSPQPVTNNILGKLDDGRLFVDGVSSVIKHNNDTLDNVIENLENSSSVVEAEIVEHENRLNDIEGQLITSGQFNSGARSLILEKDNGGQIVITGFTGGGGGLEGVTGSLVGNTLRLVDSNTPQNTVQVDLTPIITAAISQSLTTVIPQAVQEAVNEVFKSSRFLEKVNDGSEVSVVVDTTAKTVTFGFGENATLDGGIY